jgi:hypothetical protein
MHHSFVLQSSGALVGALVATLLSATALADESAPLAVEGSPMRETPDRAPTAPSAAGRGFAFGLDNGLFGSAYEQGFRLRVPVLEHFAIGLRGISAIGDRAGEGTWSVGGRAEIIGHSPVYMNLVRVYGGGGPEVMTRLEGIGGDKTAIGGGGQFGFEFFMNPKFSFFAEIGGHSGDATNGGGTALAGLMLYPFSVER